MFQDPTVVPFCTAYSLEAHRVNDLAEIYQLIIKSPPLFRALNDLIESLSIPHVSTVNCGRVIDAIRRLITPDITVPVKQAWRAMHAALNISREYQEWVSNQATGPRHADPAYVPPDITREITRRTWAIMNRYLEYRKRDAAALTDPDFPLLTATSQA
jgi:hypothetical protein